MNTSTKVLIAGGAAAVGSFFAGRSMWRGINKAKPVGLLVLAIVAYHTFDGYRQSVDTAWGKVESVVERREAAAEAEKTAAFNAQKLADAKKANEAYEKAVADQRAVEEGYRLMVTSYLEGLKIAIPQTVKSLKSADVAAVYGIFHDAIDFIQKNDPNPQRANKLLDNLYTSREAFRNEIEAAKIKAQAKRQQQTQSAAPVVVKSGQTVEQAQARYDKATAIYNELCRYGCGGEPYKQWRDARDNLARVKMSAQ